MGFASEAVGYIASGAKSLFKKKKKAPAGGQKGFVKEAASASKANMARGAKGAVSASKARSTKKSNAFHVPSLAKKLQERKRQRQKMLSQI